MCGICGIFAIQSNKKIDNNLIHRMCDKIKHRGPDDEGTFLGYGNSSDGYRVALGMRRLAIIDLKTGNQPVHNEDSSLQVVLNGEIYNFPELRPELEKRGHRFYTKTDTEILVHLYEEYGTDCVKHLRGMYAFAIWDDKNKKLFIARDRIGKKPLNYAIVNGMLIFGSEIKSMLECPELKKEINLYAIHLYMTYQYIPSPETIYKNVHKLPPASWLLCDDKGNIKIEKYWDIDFTKKTKLSFPEACIQTRELLKEATKIRLLSDVPLGAFLSGGHDSSIIVGLMSELSSEPVKTFSIGFDEEEFSELKYARIVANHFKTEHHEFVVKPQMIEMLPKLAWFYEQPYSDSSALPSYYVSNVTRQHVTVALNGDGGDESFGGYLRYAAMKASLWQSIPFQLLPKKLVHSLINLIPQTETVKAKSPFRHLHRFASALTDPPERRNILWHCIFNNQIKYWMYSPMMKEQFLNNDAYEYLASTFVNAPANTVLDRVYYTDIMTYLPECLLVKMDIASMANSLEARSPFLDHKLMEFAATLPTQWKLRGLFNTKYILKKTFETFLPETIIKRGKQGFGIPVGKWFRYELKDYIRDLLLSPKSLNRGYFRKEALEDIIKEHISGQRDHGYRLWNLQMLELWHRIYIDGEYKF